MKRNNRLGLENEVYYSKVTWMINLLNQIHLKRNVSTLNTLSSLEIVKNFWCKFYNQETFRIVDAYLVLMSRMKKCLLNYDE